MSSIVGNFACQRDSYLKRLETVVISCVPSVPKEYSEKPKEKRKSTSSGEGTTETTASRLYEIEFQDTVLFPEGGGQPEDHGIIRLADRENIRETHEILVTRVARHGLRAIHFSPTRLEPGTKAIQEVYWDRRWDHMQQHTGQHLLSAVMDTYEGLETLGWSMGASIFRDESNEGFLTTPMPNMNFVELGRKPSSSEIDEIQDRCNSIIRENRLITVETSMNANTSSLPADYDASKGVVRVINIDRIDKNQCCGTHLSQTSHISLLLLHHTQPIRGTNTRLYFTCGQRAITLATHSIRAMRSISGVVSSPINDPQNVISKVEKMELELRDAKRAKRKLEAELAKFEAEHIKRSFDSVQNEEEDGIASPNRRAFVSRVCEDSSSGMDFILSLQSELKQPILTLPSLTYDTTGLTILVTPTTYASPGRMQKEDGPGPVVILGHPTLVAKAVEEIRANPVLSEPPATEGTMKSNVQGGGLKGGGKGSRWQGKALKLGVAQIRALQAIVG